jgi:hypothetical protein
VASHSRSRTRPPPPDTGAAGGEGRKQGRKEQRTIWIADEQLPSPSSVCARVTACASLSAESGGRGYIWGSVPRTAHVRGGPARETTHAAIKWVRSKPIEQRERESELAVALQWIGAQDTPVCGRRWD